MSIPVQNFLRLKLRQWYYYVEKDLSPLINTELYPDASVKLKEAKKLQVIIGIIGFITTIVGTFLGALLG